MRVLSDNELYAISGGGDNDTIGTVTVSEVVVTASHRGPSTDFAFQMGYGFGPTARAHLGTGGTSGAAGFGILGEVMIMYGDSAMIADQRKASEATCAIEVGATTVGVKADLKSGENTVSIGPISMGNQGTNTIGPVTYNGRGEWMVQFGVSAGCHTSINIGDNPK